MLTLKRPKQLSDIVGQKAVISEFQNRFASGDIPQVMIFEGPSGTGKTSLALVIARLLNKANEAAVADIDRERFQRDVFFMDASNMSKDDVLELERTAATAPLYDECKIIIIDEAQELSKAGKGATLKLLEKPRKGVYFILCAMEPLPAAVTSRAQTYKFRPVEYSEIAQLLFDTVEREKLDIPDEFFADKSSGVFLIAEAAQGNVRTAIQLLERCYQGKLFSAQDVQRELGLITFDKQLDLLYALANGDTSFFRLIKGISLREFFYYASKIILSAATWRIDPSAESEAWKAASYEKLTKLPNFSKLIKLFEETHALSSAYFQDALFLYKVVALYDNTPMGVHKKTGRSLV